MKQHSRRNLRGKKRPANASRPRRKWRGAFEALETRALLAAGPSLSGHVTLRMPAEYYTHSRPTAMPVLDADVVATATTPGGQILFLDPAYTGGPGANAGQFTIDLPTDLPGTNTAINYANTSLGSSSSSASYWQVELTSDELAQAPAMIFAVDPNATGGPAEVAAAGISSFADSSGYTEYSLGLPSDGALSATPSQLGEYSSNTLAGVAIYVGNASSLQLAA